MLGVFFWSPRLNHSADDLSYDELEGAKQTVFFPGLQKTAFLHTWSQYGHFGMWLLVGRAALFPFTHTNSEPCLDPTSNQKWSLVLGDIRFWICKTPKHGTKAPVKSEKVLPIDPHQRADPLIYSGGRPLGPSPRRVPYLWSHTDFDDSVCEVPMSGKLAGSECPLRAVGEKTGASLA